MFKTNDVKQIPQDFDDCIRVCNTVEGFRYPKNRCSLCRRSNPSVKRGYGLCRPQRSYIFGELGRVVDFSQDLLECVWTDREIWVLLQYIFYPVSIAT